MDANEIYYIREWAPLVGVMERIPTQIFPNKFDISITCFDALDNFLALGSDVGIVFWYNRQSGEVQKLKTESSSKITSVKVVDTVEYMVAAGTSDGQLFAFQIQKALPPDLIVIAPSARKRTNLRFTVQKLHIGQICCCEWSKNGMKLYSGDCTGVVVLTEFDYQANKCTSTQILNEAYAVVQLSAHRGYLLVSTQYRSMVCVRKNTIWSVIQIGTKDRKQIVNCGGTFLKNSYEKLPRLVCARPNLRLVLANADGTVNKTLLYRDPVLYNSIWKIPLLNPKIIANKNILHETPIKYDIRNFHRIYTYGAESSLLVTHDELCLYILNKDTLKIEAVANGLRRIIDFCVCNKEIFVLEGSRTLIRLAPVPEKPNNTVQVIYNPTFLRPLPSFKSSIIAVEESTEYEPENKSVLTNEKCSTESCIDLKVHVELAVESPTANQNRRMEIFNDISNLPFDENILHESFRKIMQRHKECKVLTKNEGIVEIGLAATECEAEQRSNHQNNSVTIEDINHKILSNNLNSDNLNDGMMKYFENCSQETSKGAIKKVREICDIRKNKYDVKYGTALFNVNYCPSSDEG